MLPMRTTIELTDKQRSRLLEIAAERGENGFSHLVREAVDGYLLREEARRGRVEEARSALGSLSDDEAQELLEAVRVSRSSWR